MSDEETVNVLNWIPQVRSNNISMESANIMKPRLSRKLKLKYMSTKEGHFKRMVLCFRILEPNSLNLVNQDMNGKRYSRNKFAFLV